jgi:uncharacterized iron-regulated protein
MVFVTCLLIGSEHSHREMGVALNLKDTIACSPVPKLVCEVHDTSCFDGLCVFASA